MYNQFRFGLSVSVPVFCPPLPDGGCVCKHTVVIKCKGDAKLSDDCLNIAKKSLKTSFKALESFGVNVYPEPQANYVA
ncbi:hypothetical protein R6Q57_009442 [Mikania cordata]